MLKDAMALFPDCLFHYYASQILLDDGVIFFTFGKREFFSGSHSFENVQLLAAFCKIRLCPEGITNPL